MRAVIIPTFGGADVLTVTDLPAPSPAPGQVAVDVTHAGVNYAEIIFRRGVVPVDLPYVPGIEIAGYVWELGDGVTGLAVGEPVAALTMVDGGGYAEVAVTDARLVARLPGEPTDQQRAEYAATGSNTTTAFLALEQVAQLRLGEHVLVHAAAGGLGSQVTQVARRLGAGRVVGTVGSLAKSGATRACDEVLLRGELAGHHDRYDVIVDPVGGTARAQSLRLLHLGGRLLAVGNASDAEDTRVGTNDLWFASSGVLGHQTGAWAAGRPSDVGAALARAVAAVAAGEIIVDVTSHLPLDRAETAHRELERGRTTGKLVLETGRRALS
ncbi:quinone oxidoreductase family protein [Actinomycetospora sp. CA-101289]|uniref:quinone oxidoreductase family protein n=1 Tax=Actinomycetospora sp. CA-101289 TaxID=3239893 RepID=UPI003D9558CC